jgi:hypothetical protein
MADEVDRQLERDEILEAVRLKRIRDQVAQIPVGMSGDCDLCGEWSGRLVNGACAPCRDKYGLP